MEFRKVIFPALIGLTLGLLAVAPPIGYNIPLMINSFTWVYSVVAAGLLGFFLMRLNIPTIFKILAITIYACCFWSQAPASSFNAYILIVITLYAFALCKECDFELILKFIETVFWFEVFILVIQMLGKDRLFEFDKQHQVFFGTVFQPMRLGSLFCIMTPLLIAKSKKYFLPLVILSVCSMTLGFSLALAAGYAFYFIMTPNHLPKKVRNLIFIAIPVFAVAVCIHDWASIRVSIVEGRLPVWGVILKSWFLDTSGKIIGTGADGVWIWDPTYHVGKPDWFGVNQTGPFDWVRFLFGHGLDTFVSLFCYYKHDMNPFPQAHNDWLQIPWEIGLFNALLVYTYVVHLFYRLWQRRAVILMSGCIVIAVNMFFAFPTRMTQTVFLIVTFVAYCERYLAYAEEMDPCETRSGLCG